jgi:CRISPR/Cas system-associated endonuclease/helicase Cas3
MNTARYIVKGGAMTSDEIARIIESQLDDMIKKDYYTTKEKKNYKTALNHKEAITELAQTLQGLNDALLCGRTVFAECEKEPRNLDSGNHYYSVYYNDEKGQTQIVWGGEFLYLFIGQDRQDRDRSMRRYIFKSGAIGMSRLLDATDALFVRLKTITGTYAQIS